jgi:chromosome segregation ATPase
VQSLNQ